MFSLNDKIAIVTGSGRGIGRAISLVLAEAGATVMLTARTEKEIDETALIIKENGGKCQTFCADITDSTQVDNLMAKTIADYGRIDILINNAGQYQKRPIVNFPDKKLIPPIFPVEVKDPISDDEWKTLFDINVNSVFYCCRAAGVHMIKQKHGKVINLSSNSAIQASPYFAAYNSSKAAINMFTRVLALEWAPYNICVNAIAPGEFHTDLTEFSWSNPIEKQKRLDRIPLNREGDLRDIGMLANYLSSRSADYITGQTIYIDGGLSAK
jgi:NAD(P)-dependent dehydrogenase (short-subunit alcohol dehydrogenase family)